MTDRELMQQALEALMDAQLHNYALKHKETDDLITALRERLAQPETVMAEYKFQTYAAYKTDGEMKIGVVPEQEQALLDAITGGTGVMLGGKRIDPSTIYKEPEQEPVALETVYEAIIQWDEGGGKRSRRELARRIVALYTTPPRREWVGLTDEERNNLWRDVIGWGDPSNDDEDLMKVIEAKLKEKNA